MDVAPAFRMVRCGITSSVGLVNYDRKLCYVSSCAAVNKSFSKRRGRCDNWRKCIISFPSATCWKIGPNEDNDPYHLVLFARQRAR